MRRFEAASSGSRLAERLYARQDGTLAYFFNLQDIKERAAAAGFEAVELKYACVYNRMHKEGGVVLVERAFVHGVFRRLPPQ